MTQLISIIIINDNYYWNVLVYTIEMIIIILIINIY